MLAETEFPQQYLDTETGCLYPIESIKTLIKFVHEIGKSERYFLIAPLGDEIFNDVALDFMKDIVAQMAPEYLTSLHLAFKKGGWKEMVMVLKHHTDGWIHALDQYLFDEAFMYAEEWLTHIPGVPVFEGFENCSLCDAIGEKIARTILRRYSNIKI